MGLFNRQSEPTFTVPAEEIQYAADQVNAKNQKPADDLVARAKAAGVDERQVALAILAATVK